MPIIADKIETVSVGTDGVRVLVVRAEGSGLLKLVTGGAINFIVFTVTSFIFV